MKLSEYRLISKAINDDVLAAFKKARLRRPQDQRPRRRDLGRGQVLPGGGRPEPQGQGRQRDDPRGGVVQVAGLRVRLQAGAARGGAFRFGGSEFEIAGLRARGQKCVLGKRKDNGKMYVFTPEDVRRMLGAPQ